MEYHAYKNFDAHKASQKLLFLRQDALMCIENKNKISYIFQFSSMVIYLLSKIATEVAPFIAFCNF
ncbi:hypothetical protein T05_4682 [Trichinella murrelli]|uniref:Uncharacterized protein n=1 Tax=Trichinella murrelli TaxID=144512 RepID=A0A0V0UET3_9BILA|nr:hypothetical protein T05_4682 [Trichinella murrelli]